MDFLTTYRKHYIKKELKPFSKFGTKQEFKDPICEGFKNYLQLSNAKVPPEDPIEDVTVYVEKFKDKYPELGKIYFDKPVHYDEIERSFLTNGRTVYQVDYCDIDQDVLYIKEQEEKRRFRLPDDWDIPLTSQRYSFRDPIMLNKNALVPPLKIKPRNNLGCDGKARNIHSIGESEYQDVIGKLGGVIVNDQIHGEIVHPDCTCVTHKLRSQTE